MKQKLPMADRLLARLRKLGLSDRKAKELAKGLAPVATRQAVSGTVTGKLEAKLLKLGLRSGKAAELAKALAPTVRANIKAKAKAKAVKLSEVDDAFVEEIVNEGVDLSEDPELDKVAPRVNGHRVRLDLPIVRRSTWMSKPVKGIEILRVIDGLSTEGTYLVAAVKGEELMVAIRQFSPDHYNVKFYPTMAAWDRTEADLRALGAESHLQRQWYERMHMDRAVLDQVLGRIHAEAAPKSRITALVNRFKAVTAGPLIKAFDYLHKRVNAAA